MVVNAKENENEWEGGTNALALIPVRLLFFSAHDTFTYSHACMYCIHAYRSLILSAANKSRTGPTTDRTTYAHALDTARGVHAHGRARARDWLLLFQRCTNRGKARLADQWQRIRTARVDSSSALYRCCGEWVSIPPPNHRSAYFFRNKFTTSFLPSPPPAPLVPIGNWPFFLSISLRCFSRFATAVSVSTLLSDFTKTPHSVRRNDSTRTLLGNDAALVCDFISYSSFIVVVVVVVSLTSGFYKKNIYIYIQVLFINYFKNLQRHVNSPPLFIFMII